MSKEFTADEVAKHNKEGDAWLIIDGAVYDISKFAALHPGGKGVILGVAGQNATEQFWQFHNKQVLQKYKKRLQIGSVKGSSSGEKAQSTGEQAKKQEKAVAINQQAKRQAAAPAASSSGQTQSPAFGDLVPYGDPSWYSEWHSPYYNDSHRKFRAAVRQHIEDEIMPNIFEWDEAKKIPREMFQLAGRRGALGLALGPPWPAKYLPGIGLQGGISEDEYDAFHELITIDEGARTGSGGFMWAVSGGLAIGLPPIARWGSAALKEKVMGPVLLGDKIICLAITEPEGGSDVANLVTTAKLNDEGTHYIVNGNKKWITNGAFADYFTVAVRTGKPGAKGISFLLVERGPGVTTTQMKCSGVWPSGTAYVSFENCKVPKENLIGKEGKGFMYIVMNFNHERWSIAAQASRFARVCYEDSFKYAHVRKTFGKRLIDHPVIRLKLANMARMIESTHNWLEFVTYQRIKMAKVEQDFLLGGPIALLKAQSTTTLDYCAREASQIFGGLAYTRGGRGERVERLYREVKAFAIPGGSEEIMLDLGVKMATKVAEMAKMMLESGQSVEDMMQMAKSMM